VAAKGLQALIAAKKEGMDSWRIDEALKELRESQRLASESAICAVRALLILDECPNPEKMPSLRDEDQPDVVIKKAKLAMRDVFMWGCMGLALGTDSQVAAWTRSSYRHTRGKDVPNSSKASRKYGNLRRDC